MIKIIERTLKHWNCILKRDNQFLLVRTSFHIFWRNIAESSEEKTSKWNGFFLLKNKTDRRKDFIISLTFTRSWLWRISYVNKKSAIFNIFVNILYYSSLISVTCWWHFYDITEAYFIQITFIFNKQHIRKCNSVT